jgi:hypothetical protein
MRKISPSNRRKGSKLVYKNRYPDIVSSDNGDVTLVFRVHHLDKDLENFEYSEIELGGIESHLFILRLDNEGNLKWKKNVFMRMSTKSMNTNDGRVSSYYDTFVFGGKVYIIFNENSGDNNKMYKTRLISLDSSGKVKEEWSEENSIKDFIISPSYSRNR